MTALQGLTRVSFFPGLTTLFRTLLIRKRGSHLLTPDPVPKLPQPLVTFPWPCPGHGGATPVTLGHRLPPLQSSHQSWFFQPHHMLAPRPLLPRPTDLPGCFSHMVFIFFTAHSPFPRSEVIYLYPIIDSHIYPANIYPISCRPFAQHTDRSPGDP